MKCSTLLCLVVVGLLIASAAGAPQKKKKAKAQVATEPLDGKYAALRSAIGSRSVVRIDNQFFDRFVDQAPRNYSVIMMLTTLDPRQNCRPCKYAKQEFEVLADSWLASSANPGALVFALANYPDCPDVFNKLKVQTVPLILHFPAEGRPESADTFRSQMQGLEADAVAKFLHQRTGQKINIRRPVDFSAYLMIAAAVAMVAACVYFWYASVVQFIKSPDLWSCIAVGTILIMISGQMWNTIRNPPQVGGNQDGSISYIAGGSQNQFQMETQIVMVLYGIMTACGIILSSKTHTMTSKASQMSITVVSSVAFILILSVLMMIFRQKQYGYPFRMLL